MRILLVWLALVALPSVAQNVNDVELRGGIHLELPAQPGDSERLSRFDSLTSDQQQTFYLRRRFLLEKLIGGLSFPRVIGSLAWTRDKVSAAVGRARKALGGAASPIENVSGAEGENPPATDLKERGRLVLKTIVDVFVDKLWDDAEYVASANSVGFTLYFGPVANASFVRWGYFWGRGLSLDIGHDFTSETGYMRFYYDKQEMARAGLSFDVGAMFDFFVHFNTGADAGMNVTHYKLPVVGSYRSGPTYRAYGLQLGVNVLELTAVAIAYRHPQVAAALFMGTRFLGSATIYSTNMTRKFLGKVRVPAGWLNRIFKREGKSQPACAEALQ